MEVGSEKIPKKLAALEVQKHLRQKIQMSIFSIVFMLIGAVALRFHILVGSIIVGVMAVIIGYFLIRDRNEAVRLEHEYGLKPTIKPLQDVKE